MTSGEHGEAVARHVECHDVLMGGMAALGIDVTVSREPPIVATAYDQRPFRCPHGVTFYLAPTSEQIAAWRRDGVK